MDRPLPFLVVHVGRRREPAALDVVTANSSYLLVRNLGTATDIIKLVAEANTTAEMSPAPNAMSRRYGIKAAVPRDRG